MSQPQRSDSEYKELAPDSCAATMLLMVGLPGAGKSTRAKDARPQPQRLQGHRDEPPFEHKALIVGHRLAEQRDHPVIRGQPQRPVRRGEFCSTSGSGAAMNGRHCAGWRDQPGQPAR